MSGARTTVPRHREIKWPTPLDLPATRRAGAERPLNARALGLEDGGRARIVTRRGAAETVVEVSDVMQAGHASLPNGLGRDLTDEEGTVTVPGIAPNALTSSDWRDPFAGTPWHKHVPARIERVVAG